MIAYSMKNENIESDRTIFGPGDRSTCMILIYTGVVEITTKMDNGADFAIEKATRGSVINSTSFLFEEPLELSAKTIKPVNMYIIDKLKFLTVVGRDEKLLKKLEIEISNQLEQNNQNKFLLDLTSVREKISIPRGDPLVGTKALAGHHVNMIMKNTIIGVILKNRENRKVPKL
jgi:CRP-like cAMP-binding protein